MLEVGWSELLVIAIILIVVVGPKDLPAMMRTFGKMMGRVRTMANEFRGQFDEAMREAELDEVRKGLGEVNKYNPASSLRDAINPIRQLGQDIKSDLQKASDVAVKPAVDEGTPVAELASDPAVAPEPARIDPVPAVTTPAATPSVAPTPAAATLAQPASVAKSVAADAAIASQTAARPKAATRSATSKTTAGPTGEYPPPAKKVVKRQAPKIHVEHDVHVVADAKSSPTRAARKAGVATDAAEPVKPKSAPRKKTTKTGGA